MSIRNKRGYKRSPKEMLEEFDILTCRYSPSGPYIVIFDEDIIDRIHKFSSSVKNKAYQGLLTRNPDSFMFLENYTNDLILNSNSINKSDYDIMEIYRNPNLNREQLKKDIDTILDRQYLMDAMHFSYKKIWERQ